MSDKDLFSTEGTFTIRMDDIMIDCQDPQLLGDFYEGLLKWSKTVLNEDCVSLRDAHSSIRLLFQREEVYVPPVWPESENRQQKMMHLDFTVSDLNQAVHHARALGATMALEQYNPEQWFTMLDPAGHPFCLCLPEQG